MDDSDITRESDSNNNDLKPSAEKEEDDKRTSYANLLSEGILAGQKIAKVSVITLLSIGIAELIMGHISSSVVATADGIDSLSDAMISFIVLLGLRIAQRPADKTFHFGYHKVESLAALMAAIGMVVIGSVILYHSYEVLTHPREIQQPILTMIVLASAAVISLHRAFQMRKIANRYDILSLKTDAKNSIKDGSASVIGFFSVFVVSQFDFLQADAIGGIIIAGYIFSVSYISLKRSSLILVDSWQNPKATDIVSKSIEEKFGYESIKVRSVLLRPTGMAAQAEVHIEVDGSKPLADVELLSLKIEMEIRSKIPTIERVSVVPHSFRTPSSSSSSTSTFLKSPLSKKLSSGIFFNKK
ncbi:MAG: cation diffusion facilitator family transporter [Nitrososphaeraceae archaeon]